jgi:hypothetical protein
MGVQENGNWVFASQLQLQHVVMSGNQINVRPGAKMIVLVAGITLQVYVGSPFVKGVKIIIAVLILVEPIILYLVVIVKIGLQEYVINIILVLMVGEMTVYIVGTHVIIEVHAMEHLLLMIVRVVG